MKLNSNQQEFIYEVALVITILLILIRQLISCFQIQKLLQSISKMKKELEIKVDERTAELSKKNKELSLAVDQINHMALHDDLTGIPNRRALYTKLKQLKEQKKQFSLVFLDVNDFKLINDTFGHSYGDDVLKKVAQLLTTCCNNSGMIFRQAGDEFILIFEDIDAHLLDATITTIQKNANNLEFVPHQNLTLTFSIGISHFPDDTDDIHELIKKADFSMYDSKKEKVKSF